MTTTEAKIVDLSAETRPHVPAKAPARLRPSKRSIALGLIALGVFLVGFVLFEFTLSALVHSRSERMLLRDFQGISSEGAATTTAWVPAAGDPVAILEIPRLGVSSVVVEGTTSSLTTEGLGHFRESALPGRPGNSVIVGRRTTFGAPFRYLDRLHVGDTITVSTGVGQFEYRVEDKMAIRAGQPDPLGATSAGAQLTLITSSPPYVPAGRLAVIATIVSKPAPGPALRTVLVSSSELGLSGETAGVPGALLWTQLLVISIAAAIWVGKRISRRLAWLLGAPSIVALCWASYLSLNRVLPATL